MFIYILNFITKFYVYFYVIHAHNTYASAPPPHPAGFDIQAVALVDVNKPYIPDEDVVDQLLQFCPAVYVNPPDHQPLTGLLITPAVCRVFVNVDIVIDDHVIIGVRVGPYTTVLVGNPYCAGKSDIALSEYVKKETAYLHVKDGTFVVDLVRHRLSIVDRVPLIPSPELSE
jgi:hypothetical protein